MGFRSPSGIEKIAIKRRGWSGFLIIPLREKVPRITRIG